MLSIHRRHEESCPHGSKGRRWRRCDCPIHTEGVVGGKRLRRSLKTRNWQLALSRIRDLEMQGEVVQTRPEPQSTTLQAATEGFMADARRRNLQRPTLRKYKLLFRRLQGFGSYRSLRLVSEFELPTVREFCQSLDRFQGTSTQQDSLGKVKAFFRFCHESGWIDSNPAAKIRPPKVEQRPTMPFEVDEMRRILEACGDPEMWAFVLLMRYSGLAIQDAATLAKTALKSNDLMLRRAKTGQPVTVQLPDFVVKALHCFPHASGTHFFWTGLSTPESAAKVQSRKLKQVFRAAGLPDAHSHQLRHTFAVWLLIRGTPLEEVSILLGHSSVKTTERYYAPWVRGRQLRLKSSVARALTGDPIAKAFGTPKTREERARVN